MEKDLTKIRTDREDNAAHRFVDDIASMDEDMREAEEQADAIGCEAEIRITVTPDTARAVVAAIRRYVPRAEPAAT